MRIAIVDTAYPNFLRELPPLTGSYEQELEKLLAMRFGTHSAYSHYLREQGHEVVDVIANHEALQQRWSRERGYTYSAPWAITLKQIDVFKPDVLFMQDLSYFTSENLYDLRGKYLLAGQCSCRFEDDERLKQFAVIFTSFPFYVERFNKLGVRGVYLPLAFDPRLWEEEGGQKRTLDISFVGGVGTQSHWKQGTETLEAVAAALPGKFYWFGYGRENLAPDSPLQSCYAGPAWGREMYSVYARSKIVVNRHGEIAGGYSNNLRMYEATGMGALLMTETSRNLDSLFPIGTVCRYRDTEELLDQIEIAMTLEQRLRDELANQGQLHTLKHHTYAQRMKVVSEVLQEALVRA